MPCHPEDMLLPLFVKINKKPGRQIINIRVGAIWVQPIPIYIGKADALTDSNIFASIDWLVCRYFR